MLKVDDPTKLLMEVEAAIEVRGRHLECWDDLIRHYVGPAYDGGSGDDYHAENHAFEYLSLTIPELIFDNPKVRVTSRRKGLTQKAVARAMEHGLNRWIKDSELTEPLTAIAYDQSFAFGVAHVRQTPSPYGTPGAAVMPQWPEVCRISPNEFFMDPVAKSPRQARFMGHAYVRDKDDLIAEAKDNPEAGWDLKAVRELATDVELDKVGRHKWEDEGGRSMPSRNEVVLYEVWVPEVQHDPELGPDEGFNGTIYTIAAGQNQSGERKASYVREPRPYYGPASGPYVLFGAYVVPDRSFPLSPLQAVKVQADELNQEVEAASEGARDYKRLIILDTADKELAKQIKDGRHHGVYTAKGLNAKEIVNAEVGGLTDQQLKQIEWRRDRLERNSGMSDAHRGRTDPGVSATADAIADEASSKRMAYIKKGYTKAVARVITIAAWYLFHDDRVVFPLGDITYVDPASMEVMPQPEFQGGMHALGTGMRFEDLELEIEPYSMERTNEAMMQQRWLALSELILKIVPQLPMMPWFKGKQWLEKGGQVFNDADLGEVIDEDVLAALMGAQAMGAGMEPTPRLEKGIGGGQRPPAPAGDPMNRRKQAMNQSLGARGYAGVRR